MVLPKSSTFLLVLIASLLIFTQTSYSQGGGGQGSISGLILDATTTKPVEFGTVSLHKMKDSSLVTGTITDMNGNFKIQNIPFGNYFLRASFIGYEKTEIKNLKINPEKSVLTIPTIHLKLSEGNLTEVVIEAEKAMVENHIDKKVYNTDKDLDSKGGTAVDALRNIPSVDIDENDNVTLRGDGSVQVLIDGRPSSIPIAVLLKQINASDIERIEIVTNPGAKYDPEGMAGIINIVLKKSKQKGFNGNVNLGYGQGILYNYNGGTALNWRREKFNISLNASHNKNPHWNEGISDRTTFFLDSTYQLKTNSGGEWVRQNTNIKTGIDYFINDKNTVYINGSFGIGGNSSNSDNDYQHFGNGELFLTSQATSLGSGNNQNFSINTGWQSTLSKKMILDFDINFDRNNSLSNTHNIETQFNVNPSLNTQPIDRKILQDDINDVLLSRLDFTYTINDSMSVEFGARVTINNENKDFIGTNYDYSTELYEYDSSITNNFLYNQSVFATYATFSHKIRKFGYKAGLRAERTLTSSDLTTTNVQFTNNYNNLFPSIHLSYSISDKSEVQLSYSKRIKRPDPEEVNPFANFSDPYSIRVGNPFLRPENIDAIEMGLSQRIKSNWNFNGSIYFKLIHDQIRRFPRVEDNLFILSYSNLQDSKVGGTDISLSYRKKGFSFMGSGNYWYSIINDSELTSSDVPSYGWSTNLMANYKFKNELGIQTNFVYRGGMLMAHGFINPRYNFNVSFNKSFLKKTLQLSLGFRDIFRTMFFNIESKDLLNLDFNTYRYFDSRRVTFSASYNFGQMNQQAKQKRKLKTDDNGNSLPDM
jgi:iron complex outermembrane recepter protein